MKPFSGFLDFPVLFEVREFDLDSVPELRKVVEDCLSRYFGEESFSSFMVPGRMTFSDPSRAGVRSLIRVRRRPIL